MKLKRVYICHEYIVPDVQEVIEYATEALIDDLNYFGDRRAMIAVEDAPEIYSESDVPEFIQEYFDMWKENP